MEPAAPAPAPVQNTPEVVAPQERPWLTFPPFPKALPGVELVPFTAFKPQGIHIVPDPPEGHVEVDALGIPTVALRVQHDLTAMEKRKKKTKNRLGANGIMLRQLWYEEWEEGETFRRTAAPIDPSHPRSDRFHQAAYDFKAGRSFAQHPDLMHLWDRFRIFVGLITSLQPPVIRKKNAAMRHLMAQQREEDEDEDEEFEEMANVGPPKTRTVGVTTGEGGEGARQGAAPQQQPPSGQVWTEEQRQQRREYYREVRDTRMDRFLNDPEKTIKIFFSGYYRDRGMSGSERHCRDGPILLSFFINFLLRNRVLPESEKDLRKALAATELARKELPQTFVISRTLPDAFSKGCEMVFGTLTNAMAWNDVSDSSDEDEGPDAKRQKKENAQWTAEEAAVLKAAAAAAGEEIEVVTRDAMMGMEQDMKDLAANANLKGTQDPVPSTPNEDPAAAPAEDMGGWGMPTDDVPDPSTYANITDWGASTAADWGMTPSDNPLTRFLGPTTLPLTHTTGIVEHSTRRVKAVFMPPAPPSSAPAKKGGKKGGSAGPREPVHAPEHPDAEVVEAEVEARFARIVLAPWHEWDLHTLADVRKPWFEPDSRGAVRTDDGAAPDPDFVGPVHDPFHDEITIYVEPAAAATVWVGMGVEATWIQLARVDPTVPVELSQDAFDQLWVMSRKKKQPGAPGTPVAPTKIWYMESVRNVVTSYHTEMIPLPTTEEVFGENEAA